MSLQSWVNQKFGFVAPIRPELRPVEVEFEVNDVMDLVDAYMLEVDRKYVMTKIADALDAEQLAKYLTTLLVLRIDFVTRGRKFQGYNLRQYSVPAFMAAYLLNIGIVEDHDFGLLLIPVYQAPKEVMTHEEMVKFAQLIRALRDAFRPVDWPNGKEGNLEFMSKITLGPAIKSYRPRDHVVFAFLSSVVKKVIRDEILLQFTTVHYGDAAMFRREIPLSEVPNETLDAGPPQSKIETVPQSVGV